MFNFKQNFFKVLVVLVPIIATTPVVAETSYDGYIKLFNQELTRRNNPFVTTTDEFKIRRGLTICAALDEGYTLSDVNQAFMTGFKMGTNNPKTKVATRKAGEFEVIAEVVAINRLCPRHRTQLQQASY